MFKLLRTAAYLPKCTLFRNISCSTRLTIDQKWREGQGLPANPNEFGPLTNLPDYTFLDGRPTPMGARQRTRLIKQKEIAQKIVAMNKELNMAKERYQQLNIDKEINKQNIMQAKLKPKGKYLLEKISK